MLHRLKSRLVFPKSSGMATWARDQMAVRHGQAVHINEGEDNEEPKYNDITDYGNDLQEVKCDLPLLDENHAIDAYNTLTDASVWAWLADGAGVNWVEHHTCDHDETVRTGCKTQSRKEHGEPLEEI